MSVLIFPCGAMAAISVLAEGSTARAHPRNLQIVPLRHPVVM